MTITSVGANPNVLVDVRGLAAQLGISVSSVYRRRSTGEPLPKAVKIGKGSIRWRQSDIDAWLEAQLEEVA